MCLVTESKPVTLDHDLIVYKILIPQKDNTFKASHQPYYYGQFVRQNDVILKAKSRSDFDYGDSIYANYEAAAYYDGKRYVDIYDRGYHFYTTFKKAVERNIFYECILKCRVPKGCVVVYDETGLGVASTIIIERKVTSSKDA